MPKEHVVSVDPFKPLAEDSARAQPLARGHRAGRGDQLVSSPSIHSLKPNAYWAAQKLRRRLLSGTFFGETG